MGSAASTPTSTVMTTPTPTTEQKAAPNYMLYGGIGSVTLCILCLICSIIWWALSGKSNGQMDSA